MPKTNVILVDYENVQTNLDVLQSIKVENVKIYVFVGQNQKITVDLSNNIHENNGKFIQMEGTGKNALDFHIAYFIGRLSKENNNYCFHIISKDTGFDVLIKYLKKNNIICYREAEIKDTRIFTLQQKANSYKEKFITSPNKPKKEKTLIAAIKAFFTKEAITEEDAKDIIDLLKKEKILSIDNTGKVSYKT
jgi:hypothetical protein